MHFCSSNFIKPPRKKCLIWWKVWLSLDFLLVKGLEYTSSLSSNFMKDFIKVGDAWRCVYVLANLDSPRICLDHGIYPREGTWLGKQRINLSYLLHVPIFLLCLLSPASSWSNMAAPQRELMNWLTLKVKESFSIIYLTLLSFLFSGVDMRINGTYLNYSCHVIFFLLKCFESNCYFLLCISVFTV